MIIKYKEKYGDEYEGKTSGQKYCEYGTNVVVNVTNNQG